MVRAQRRDAVRSQKFYFRKDVFPPTSSSASSIASSCASSPIDGPQLGLNGTRKEKKLRNCFPPAPKPYIDYSNGAIEDEYEEMTMVEIMNGKVSNVLSMAAFFKTVWMDG